MGSTSSSSKVVMVGNRRVPTVKATVDNHKETMVRDMVDNHRETMAKATEDNRRATTVKDLQAHHLKFQHHGSPNGYALQTPQATLTPPTDNNTGRS